MEAQRRLAALAEAINDPGSAQMFPFTMDRPLARWLVQTAQAAEALREANRGVLASLHDDPPTDHAAMTAYAERARRASNARADALAALVAIGPIPPEPAPSRSPRSYFADPGEGNPVLCDAFGEPSYFGLLGEQPGDLVVATPAPGGGVMRSLVESGPEPYRVNLPAIGAPEARLPDGTVVLAIGGAWLDTLGREIALEPADAGGTHEHYPQPALAKTG